MGRQKIEIRPIEREGARQVCFSKRRSGLFKKANELAILCGAEVAAVVFSRAGNAFSFGHPSVESIIERFDPTGMDTEGGGGGAAEDNNLLADLNRQHQELRAKLDAAKVKKDQAEAAMAMAKERSAAIPIAAWLEADVRDMGEEELMQFAAALQVVQAAVAARANQVLQDALNHGRAMAARNPSNMVPVTAPPQQLLGMGAGGYGWYDFGAGSSGSATNAQEMDMQMQMMMAMTPPQPPPGFAVAGMEQLLQQGFGFPGLY
ncbi:hypothetical protein ACQ4PT_007397 [Festuca glaucescens]